MELTKGALTSGIPGSTMVEEISSLSKGGSRTGIAEDRAKDQSGGLETAMLLK